MYDSDDLESFLDFGPTERESRGRSGRRRSRSRTVTASGSRRSKTPARPPLPSPMRPNLDESRHRAATLDAPPSPRSVSGTHSYYHPQPVDPGKTPKAKGKPKRGMSLPRLIVKRSPSTASSASIPTPDLPPALQQRAIAARDSYENRTSVSSSSVYPLSLTSASAIPSPASAQSFLVAEPEVFDVDDINARLHLLANNSYFLPPAHSKPALSSLAPPSAREGSRSPGGILGFFSRKPRSSPVSPALEQYAPQTSEPIRGPTTKRAHPDVPTPGGYLTPSVPGGVRTPEGTWRQSGDRPSRVVVVREKLDDLWVTAEQDTRRGRAGHQQQRTENPPARPVYIDPTDIVDVAPPPADYPLAMQPSEAYGLGVVDSLGAALLAERLPPRGSPIWSSDNDEDAWRKALLQEAVNLSLSGTPVDFSFLDSSVSDPASPRVTGESERTGGAQSLPLPPDLRSAKSSTPLRPGTAGRSSLKVPDVPLIGRRIADPRTFESSEDEDTPAQASSSSPSRRNGRRPKTAPNSGRPGQMDERMLSPSHQHGPPRAESPAAPQTPLAPAPRTRRKPLLNPLQSLSQDDLHEIMAGGTSPRNSVLASGVLSPNWLRRSFSSPMLKQSYESGATGVNVSTDEWGVVNHRQLTRNASPSLSLLVSDPDGRMSVPLSRDHEGQDTSRSVSVASMSRYSRDDIRDQSPAPRPSFSAFGPGGRSRDVSPNTTRRESLDPQHARAPSPFAQRSFGLNSSLGLQNQSNASRVSHVSTNTMAFGPNETAATGEEHDHSSELPSFGSRFSTMSPPPRPSSTFITPLAPPPARARKTIQDVYYSHSNNSRQNSGAASIHSFDSSRHSFNASHSEPSSSLYYSASPARSLPHILAPEPTTPPYHTQDVDEPDTKGTRTSVELHEPRVSINSFRPSVRSAEPSFEHSATQATSFFDQIQEHADVLDDPYGDEEEDSDEDFDGDAQYVEMPAQAYPAPPMSPPLPSPRPSFFQHNNCSSSSLRTTGSGGSGSGTGHGSSNVVRSLLPSIPASPRRAQFPPAVSNVPATPTFFSKLKRNNEAPATSLQFYQYARGSTTSLAVPGGSAAAPVSGSSDERTSSSEGHGTSDETHRASTTVLGERGADAGMHRSNSVRSEAFPRASMSDATRRLDGMLVQHMEAERNRLKRLTSELARK